MNISALVHTFTAQVTRRSESVGPYHDFGVRLFGKSMAARTARLGQSPRANYSAAATVDAPKLTEPSCILPQVAAGESRAMNRCISQYGALVWTIVRRYIKDTAEAEDLVQEVFTEIWKKAATFNPKIATETTFVGLIARRRAIDSLRRQGRRPDFDTLDAAAMLPLASPQVPTIGCDPEMVRSSLATLPTETRELFSLFFEEGFTHPEIAEKTGLPLGTVKTRLRRGLITLREQLQRVGNFNQTTAP